MRVNRSQAQWREIIQQHINSNLSIVDFCREHNLSTTTFYSARKKLSAIPKNFVKAKVTQQIEVSAEQANILITVGQASVSLPATISASYLASVLKELA